MKKVEKNYKYLLRLYSQIDDYLSDDSYEEDNLPETIISFCIATERLLKIKLYQANPVLVFENCKIKENDALISVIKNKEQNIETIKINEVLDRYKLMFDEEFSDDEMQALIDIYKVRNHFIHGYKSDNEILKDKENIIKKMGTVWEKISQLAILIFGNDIIKPKKPKKKYTENELEGILTEEVKKKIKNDKYLSGFNQFPISGRGYGGSVSLFGGEERCPRCGSYGFTFNNNHSNGGLVSDYSRIRWNSFNNYAMGDFSDLYRCDSCNLELTKKEFEIAKKLKK